MIFNNGLKKTEVKYEEIYDKTILFLIPVILIILRIYRILSLRIDSDEPQHMHIIWSWTKKIVQYRDVFDNHTPLFHILIAPFIKMVGATPYILMAGRILMIPFFIWNLILVYLISKILFNKKITLYLTFFTGFYLNYNASFVEFRPDNLWIILWLESIYYILKSKVNFYSGLILGFIIGLNSMVSLKTIAFLLPSLVLSYFLYLVRDKRPVIEKLKFWNIWDLKFLLGFITGGISIFIFLLVFYKLNALSAFIYCTLLHNIVPGLYKNFLWKFIGAILSILIALFVSKRYENLSESFIFFMFLSFSLLAISIVYPVMERETKSVVFEMFFILIVGLILENIYYKMSSKKFFLYISGGYAFFILLVMTRTNCWCENRSYEKMYDSILKLTDDFDYVMDAKGENIFRTRPYYFAFELFTKRRIKLGLIDSNQIIADLIKKKNYVIVSKYENVFPENLRNFSNSEYINVEQYIKVAGKKIAEKLLPGERIKFNIVLSGEYRVIAKGKNLEFIVDNIKIRPNQKFYLSAGTHYLVISRGKTEGSIILIISKALERGFYPFDFKVSSESKCRSFLTKRFLGF